MKPSCSLNEYSFTQWQEGQERSRHHQNRCIWAASLTLSTLGLLGMISMASHYSNRPHPVPAVDTSRTIDLDLSSDMISEPVAMTSLPQTVETLPESLPDPAANLPSLPQSDTYPVLPKIQQFKKIAHFRHAPDKKPVPIKKMDRQAQPALPPHHSVNNTTLTQGNAMQHQQGHAASTPANWQGAVMAKLETYKHYPNEAQSEEQEGTVILHISLDRQGHVLTASLVKSSGYGLLDKEALALSHRVNPLPAPPDTIKGTILNLTIPVEFHLHKN